MKLKTRLTISVALNLAFLFCFILLAYTYRDKLYQSFVSVKGKPKIIMFGNSITAQGKWVELLGRTDVMTRALPGQCTYHFLNAIKPMVTDLHPEICFVMGGINDITIGVSPEKIQEHYRLILENLVQNKIIPVVTLTLYEQNDPASKAKVKQLNDFLISYCKTNNIDYLDINPLLADSTGLKPEYAVDKTHLNEKAYKVWAVEIDRVLKEKGM
ncbi:GDSL-type esterase/lipase family protein [Dyadobacter sp. CY312]|uniref:GDSL-type esterase/lipase family protein n=1 Tax=Dyadobacter sp. CY312 TaxID=2907303 RepID=UPI001F2890A8|nr:GDSL-type esterase/lipase family protein [Dyadobacter sp. CY312]MCE7043716.1 GDSL-type esterase/lipase family protein [Dyadobacter sp. CY312]